MEPQGLLRGVPVGVGPHQGYLLRMYGALVGQAFGGCPYQVGSSLTEKRDWRDVDVRLILEDEEYDALFGPEALDRRVLEMAFTALGRDLTKLPIDFQIQRRTEANAEFPGVRSALLLTDDDLPVARKAA